MHTCLICLNENKRIRKICKKCGARVHIKCQKKFDNKCIICKTPTHVKTRNSYYVDRNEYFSDDEYYELYGIIERRQDHNRFNLLLQENLNVITSYTTIYTILTNIENITQI